MTEPKLALIPSAYKAGTLYSPLPSNGDGDFTFSRATTATRVNKDGFVKDINADVPRIDYSDSGCPSLLLEPTRTNSIKHSEDFTDSDWIKYNIGTSLTPIIEENFDIQPDGTLNATRLKLDLDGGTTISDRTFIRQSLTTNTGYYFSVYLKSNTNTNQKLLWHNGGDISEFEISTEWKRYELDTTAGSTSWCGLALRGSSSSVNSADVLIWGFQAEQGTKATSYIPTATSAATRNQDSCNGAGDATLFNDNEGVLFVETKGFIDIPAANGYIQLSKSGESSFNNSLVIQHRNNGFLRIYANGSAGTDLHFNINVDFTQNHKIAVLYKLNGYKLFIDGVAQSLSGTPTQTVFSGLDDLSFNLRGSSNWNAKIKDLRYYNTELTDTELIELTTL